MNPATGTRLTAAERKEAVLQAARVEFAQKGYVGASTEDIAARAGISQPYLFRLFGTKKELYIASANRCFRETLDRFQRAAEGLRGEEALQAAGRGYMEQLREDRTFLQAGHAYMEHLQSDRMWLRGQMQAYSASDDPEIRAVVRAGFGDLVAYARRVSGADWDVIWGFFATGMLLNVLASMHADDDPEQWMTDLLDSCGKQL
jgi:AcrR family transcriptional regulator